MSVIRSFIALDFSADVLRNMDQALRMFQDRMAGLPIRWTPVQNMHLTLKFLGDVSEANLRVLFKILDVEAGRHSAFEIQVRGFGAFPAITRPRVLWMGIEAPQRLLALQHAIDAETARLGYASEERAYSPHLTLGRVGRNANTAETRMIGEILAGVQAGSLGACLIDAVHFYRSDLNPQGSIYTRLYSAMLKP
jgi:2'-5' RNA ligase